MAKKPIKKVAKKKAAPSKKAATKKVVKKAAKPAKKATRKMPISAKTGKIVTAKYAKAHPKTTVNLTVKKKVAKKVAKVVKKTAKKPLALPAPKPTAVKAVVKGRIPDQTKKSVAATSVTNTTRPKMPSFDKAGWEALGNDQKREFLVTNCIKLMEQGLGVGKGDYIKSPSLEKSLKRIGQRTDFKTMLENASDVKVCGAGILLYADILLRGGYDVYQGADIGAIGLDDIQRRLYYFSEQQLKEIESAFEGKWAFANDDKHNIPAVIFGQKFSDDRRRMAAILQNILTNRGTFRP